MRGDATGAADAVLGTLTAFFSSVFLAFQMHFWGQGDSHMMTLMCGLCLMCCGVHAGWSLASRRKGGESK